MNQIPLSGETHCTHCECPKEIWAKSLTTYQGDECQLFESFLSLAEFKLSAAELTEIATRELSKEFPDIADIDATVKELMGIILECGVLDNPYPEKDNLERIKQCAALAIEDNTRQFGRGFAHSATTATIGYLISGMENLIDEVRPLKPEEILECIKFALEHLGALVKDETIPWETTTSRLIAGRKKKRKA